MSRQVVPNSPNGKILTNQTMAGTFVSPVVDTYFADGVAWEALYTGTPTGTFTFESSNQYDVINNPTPTFIPIPAAQVIGTLPVPAGAGSSFIVTTPGVSRALGAGRYQRLRYTQSGGTGSLSLWAFGTGAA
jgi:hypothetical protein